MAYKFQLGDATLSGSLLQEGDITSEGDLAIQNSGQIGCAADADLITLANQSVAFANNADVNIAKAGGLQIGGSAVTATAAELNRVDVAAGAATAGKALIADASTLVKFPKGSKSGLFGAADTDNAIQFGDNQEVSIYFNEAQVEGLTLAISSSEGGVLNIMADESQDAVINLTADQHDDGGDMWEIACKAQTDKFVLSNDIASQGTQVEHFSITPHATASNSTAAFAGNVTVGGNLTISGTTTTVDTTNLLVKDKLITLNDGGAAGSADGSGIEFEEDGSATGFIKVAGDRAGYEIQAPGNNNTLTIDATATKTLTVGGNFNIDADITANASEINLLDAGAGSSVGLEGADGVIIFDNSSGDAAAKVLLSDITALAARADVALIDNLGTGSVGVNYWADLGGAESMVLPNSPTVGDSIKIKAPSNCSVSNKITISPLNASHRIDGQTSIVLESPFAAVELIYVVNNHWRVF